MASNASRVLEGLKAANSHSKRPGKWSSVWEVAERTTNASNIQDTLNSLVKSGRVVTKNGLYKATSIYSSNNSNSRSSLRGDRGTPRGDRSPDSPRETPRGTPNDSVRRTADTITTMLFGGTRGGSGR